MSTNIFHKDSPPVIYQPTLFTSTSQNRSNFFLVMEVGKFESGESAGANLTSKVFNTDSLMN